MAANLQVRLRVAKRVKRLRRLRGWSQEQLAERAGESAKHISEIERARTNVSIDSLTSIAGALAVDVVDLFRASSAGPASIYVLTRDDVDRIHDALQIIKRAKRDRARRAR